MLLKTVLRENFCSFFFLIHIENLQHLQNNVSVLLHSYLWACQKTIERRKQRHLEHVCVHWSQCLKYRTIAITPSHFDSAHFFTELKLVMMSSFFAVFLIRGSQSIIDSSYYSSATGIPDSTSLTVHTILAKEKCWDAMQPYIQLLLTSLANHTPRHTRELKHVVRKMVSKCYQAHITAGFITLEGHQDWRHPLLGGTINDKLMVIRRAHYDSNL